MKKPKRVRIKFAKISETISGYRCPHCKTYFRPGPCDNVIKFKCSRCDNEIIVDGFDEISANDLIDSKYDQKNNDQGRGRITIKQMKLKA